MSLIVEGDAENAKVVLGATKSHASQTIRSRPDGVRRRLISSNEALGTSQVLVPKSGGIALKAR
jgi:hypothetical protein